MRKLGRTVIHGLLIYSLLLFVACERDMQFAITEQIDTPLMAELVRCQIQVPDSVFAGEAFTAFIETPTWVQELNLSDSSATAQPWKRLSEGKFSAHMTLSASTELSASFLDEAGNEVVCQTLIEPQLRQQAQAPPATAPPQPSPQPPSPPAERTVRSFRFTVQSEEIVKTDVDIVFVVDNSASMSEEIASLRKSIGSLISRMASIDDVRFNVSFITAAGYLSKTGHPYVAKVAGGTTLMNPFFRKRHPYSIALKINDGRLNRGWWRPSQYSHAEYSDVFGTNQMPNITRYLDRMYLSTSFAKEPLIAAAMEYLNFRSFTDDERVRLFTPDHLVHFVVVSDEDNSQVFSEKSYVHSTGFYYGSSTVKETSYCGSRGKDSNKEEKRFRLRSNQYCVNRDRMGTRRPFHGSSYECKYKGLNLGESYRHKFRDYSDKKFCKGYYKWNCKKLVDETLVDVETYLSSTEKVRYQSCSPILEKGFSYIFLTDAQIPTWNDKQHSKIQSCYETTCQLAAYRSKYTAKSTTPTVIDEIVLEPCDNGFSTETRNGKYSVYFPGYETVYCPDELTPSARSKLPSGIILETDEDKPIDRVRQLHVVLESEMSEPSVTDKVANHLRVPSAKITWTHSPKSFEQFMDDSDGFINFVKTVHPRKSVFFHSIVNVDGKPCPGQSNATAVKGSEYMKISEAMDSKVGNMCDQSWDNIVSALADHVVLRTRRGYDLPKVLETQAQGFPFAERELAGVKNITLDEQLPEQDYSYEGGILQILRTSMETGHQIEVRFFEE